MQLRLLYHRIGIGKNLSIKEFEKHLIFLKTNEYKYTSGHRKGLFLTFDDATADFYYNVFPLLKKYKIPATLAVPTAFILEGTSAEKGIRLSFKEEDLFTLPIKKSPFFCTYVELREMLASGFITIASHSHTHANLLFPDVDLETELLYSKSLLEKNLKISVNTFVYPYGAFNLKLKEQVSKYYSFQMRIGSAYNRSSDFFYYRIPCDQVKDLKTTFSYKNRSKYLLKSFLNKVRNR